MSRRHVYAGSIVTIGKEANRVDDRATGLADFSDADRLLVTYAEPQDLPWDQVLAIAKQQPLAEVADAIGRSRKRTADLLNGRSRPRKETRRRLMLYAARESSLAGFDTNA